jgi:hypothetical protein
LTLICEEQTIAYPMRKRIEKRITPAIAIVHRTAGVQPSVRCKSLHSRQASTLLIAVNGCR